MNINSQAIQQAALQAKQQGKRAIELLEAESGLNPANFILQLAATFSYPQLNLAQMAALQPAFDKISDRKSVCRERV